MGDTQTAVQRLEDCRNLADMISERLEARLSSFRAQNPQLDANNNNANDGM